MGLVTKRSMSRIDTTQWGWERTPGFILIRPKSEVRPLSRRSAEVCDPYGCRVVL